MMELTDLKLTDKDICTYNSTQWVPGEWKETSGEGDLCDEGWLHYYHGTPELAVCLDPIHGCFGESARLWRVEVDGVIKEEPIKRGADRLRLVEELPLPTVSTEARIRWAIYVTRAIPGRQLIPAWEKWADRWISGEDRSATAASRAAWAAGGEAWAAWAAAAEAAWAARAAAEAAADSGPIDLAGLLDQAIREEAEHGK